MDGRMDGWMGGWVNECSPGTSEGGLPIEFGRYNGATCAVKLGEGCGSRRPGAPSMYVWLAERASERAGWVAERAAGWLNE